MDAGAITGIFNAAFLSRYHTVLKGGGSEPLYTPPAAGKPALIVFREDFAASALHEVAHWCIAGERRRMLMDYGYWYESERDEPAQVRFQRAEANPQALEWVFSNAAGMPFRISADNTVACAGVREQLRRAVRDAADHWIKRGLPARALQFANGLAEVSGCGPGWSNGDAYRLLPA